MQVASSSVPAPGVQVGALSNGMTATTQTQSPCDNTVKLATGAFVVGCLNTQDVKANFGAKCDGSTDDSVGIQAGITWLATNGGELTSPSGANCKFGTGLTYSFSANSLLPKHINLQGGTWSSVVASGPAIYFQATTGNPSYARDISIENGHLTDAGNASDMVKFQGGDPSLNQFMGGIHLEHLEIDLNASNTNCVNNINTFESVAFDVNCVNLGGAGYGFYFSQGTGSQTGDWTLIRDSTRGFTNGIYSNGGNSIKVYSGTFLEAQQYGGLFNNSSAIVVDGAHFENNWQTGSDTYKPGVYLIGEGTITEVECHNSTGTQKACVEVFAGNGSEIRVNGGQDYGCCTVYLDSNSGATGYVQISGVPTYGLIGGNLSGDYRGSLFPVLGCGVSTALTGGIYDAPPWTSWTGTAGTFTPNIALSPNCLISAATMTEDTSNAQHFALSATITHAWVSATVTLNQYVRQTTGTRNASVALFDQSFTNSVNITFSPSCTVAGTNVTGWVLVSAAVTPITGGWCLVSLSVSGVTATAASIVTTMVNGASTSYTGDGVSTMAVWGVDVR